MFSLHKSDFTKLCKKNGKTREECEGCIKGTDPTNPNLLIVDENSEFYPCKKISKVIQNFNLQVENDIKPLDVEKKPKEEVKSPVDYFKSFNNR